MNVTLLRYFPYYLLIVLSTTKYSYAELVGYGKVRMQGSVIEAACAIDTASRDQTIDMSILPLSQLINYGESNERVFSINLVNCLLKQIDTKQPSWSHFQVTFDGPIDHDLFRVDGHARGVALQISDSAGNIAIPGIPLPSISFVGGGQKLDYSLRLVGNQQELRGGDYNSTIRFRMSYY